MEKFKTQEIDQFVEDWGQEHSEICANLGYEEEGSDDLLIVDYFFYADKWIPKITSGYGEREQEIADYLRLD